MLLLLIASHPLILFLINRASSTFSTSSYFSFFLKTHFFFNFFETSSPPQHLSHIGYDAENGFDVNNIPDEWQKLFDKAGVTKEQLQDKET